MAKLKHSKFLAAKSVSTKTRKNCCPQQVVFRKPADYSKLVDYNKAAVYKCKLADYSKVVVYKCTSLQVFTSLQGLHL